MRARESLPGVSPLPRRAGAAGYRGRALTAVAVLFGVALAACARPAPPKVVAATLARAPRGAVTVVFFTDFQCPFCRRTHAALASAIAEQPDDVDVRVVLRHVPLRRHPDAWTAAATAICTEASPNDGGEKVARALSRSPDLSEEACVAIAAELASTSAEALRTCMAAPETEERIARDGAEFESADGDGVPLLFVGAQRLDGAQTKGALLDALASARADASAADDVTRPRTAP